MALEGTLRKQQVDGAEVSSGSDGSGWKFEIAVGNGRMLVDVMFLPLIRCVIWESLGPIYPLASFWYPEEFLTTSLRVTVRLV